MPNSSFSSLTNVPLREAWSKEDRDFTPWLSEHLEQLGEAVGIDLELIQTEIGLPTEDDSFAADIFARNLHDDSNVLIENQLEKSDHAHVGQILTYLAGLEARTVIWVAASFREAHLAALRWLNEHTSEEFAFFAVVIKVVRIESSPLAPVFEIVENPIPGNARFKQELEKPRHFLPLALNVRHFGRNFKINIQISLKMELQVALARFGANVPMAKS